MHFLSEENVGERLERYLIIKMCLLKHVTRLDSLYKEIFVNFNVFVLWQRSLSSNMYIRWQMWKFLFKNDVTPKCLHGCTVTISVRTRRLCWQSLEMDLRHFITQKRSISSRSRHSSQSWLKPVRRTVLV